MFRISHQIVRNWLPLDELLITLSWDFSSVKEHADINMSTSFCIQRIMPLALSKKIERWAKNKTCQKEGFSQK